MSAVLSANQNSHILNLIRSIIKAAKGRSHGRSGSLDEFGTRNRLPRLTKVRPGKADFSRVDLSGANANRGANSFGARSAVADLRASDFGGPDLSRADLPNGGLGGANLCQAKLVEAELTRANLRATKRDKADIFNADFDAATFGRSDQRLAESLWNWPWPMLKPDDFVGLV